MYDTPEFLILFAPKCLLPIKRTVCKKSKSKYPIKRAVHKKIFFALNTKRTVRLIGIRE